MLRIRRVSRRHCALYKFTRLLIVGDLFMILTRDFSVTRVFLVTIGILVTDFHRDQHVSLCKSIHP